MGLGDPTLGKPHFLAVTLLGGVDYAGLKIGIIVMQKHQA